MKTKGQFVLFTLAEFAEWLANTEFTRKVVRIQNHHTWKPRYKDFSGTNHFPVLAGMKKHHMEHNGWADIGQHVTTFPDGTVAICRPFERTPACIYGANAGTICIEHLGNFDKGGDTMTAAHRDCIIQVNALLCKEFRLAANTDAIVYHHWYDLSTGKRNDGAGNNKTCPGEKFFGGNKVADCAAEFIPLVKAALTGGAPKEEAGKLIAFDAPVSRARVAVQNEKLVIRSGPSAAADDVGSLPDGMLLQIYEAKGIWRRIDPAQPYWVSSKFLASA